MVDSINRITSALESAREITLEAAAVATSRLGESSYRRYSKGLSPEALHHLLSSRNPREVKDGMKRIISVMASGEDTIGLDSYFADVVKNVTSEDTKIKRLVAIYLLRFAESDPDLALLSINSIQKSLSDADPQVRSLSLKVLSDIKIPSLYPIVLHSIKKSLTDSSAVVRSTVATALLKLCREQGEDLRDDALLILKDLLADADAEVVSSAILLLQEVFPDRLEILHGHFRRYCTQLPQFTEWSQVSLIELLTRYCRTYLPKPLIVDTSGNSNSIPLPDEYIAIPFAVYEVDFDPDLKRFLTSLESLVFSPNAAVVVAISKAFLQLSPPLTFKNSKISLSLVRLISSGENSGLRGLILQCILLYSSMDSTLFLPFIKKFYLLPSDDVVTSVTKLKIISFLVNITNANSVISELQYYIKAESDPLVIQEALNTLAVCAQLSNGLCLRVTKWLLANMGSHTASLVMDAYVNVIRYLIQKEPARHLTTMLKLSAILKDQPDLSGTARSGIIWLFGEFAAIRFDICPDILRVLIPNFSRECKDTRSQILLLAAKLLSYDIDKHHKEFPEMEYDFTNSRISEMFQAVLYLAKFDDNFDIRDRARTFSSLFDKGKTEIAALLLQAPKPSPIASTISHLVEGTASSDLSSLGIDSDLEAFFYVHPWNVDVIQTSDSDPRAPTPLKDYSRLKTSFSSKSYFKDSFGIEPETVSGRSMTNTSPISSPSPTFTSSGGRKYQLQSLDEFFSDVPAKSKMKRRVIVEESSTEDSASDSDDDSSDGSSDDSGDGDSSYEEENDVSNPPSFGEDKESKLG
ncbi:LAFE_0E13894g1_1 [Lachancea fermentati]|uniref:LAFE_0E13894g1_1 n=1 Tax=Lachancea fermentati TaxID=4955 RepID=A0A1G4ME06_LACFM|nr:LAFE_0E13894g1_1 [Lachancea fermentati]